MTSNPPDTVSPNLRHLVIVAGRPSEWAAFSDQRWADRLADLGKIADHAGIRWLTVRPFGGDEVSQTIDLEPRSTSVGSCLVRTDPEVDGRHRLIVALDDLTARGDDITDVAISRAINSPAETDPDLVLVFGSGHELPPSLVWELAYAELVFTDASWDEVAGGHVTEAIETFSHRHRRFGGLD